MGLPRRNQFNPLYSSCLACVPIRARCKLTVIKVKSKMGYEPGWLVRQANTISRKAMRTIVFLLLLVVEAASLYVLWTLLIPSFSRSNLPVTGNLTVPTDTRPAQTVRRATSAVAVVLESTPEVPGSSDPTGTTVAVLGVENTEGEGTPQPSVTSTRPLRLPTWTRTPAEPWTGPGTRPLAPTWTPTPTATRTRTPTSTPTRSSTPTATTSPSHTPTATPTALPSHTPTATRTTAPTSAPTNTLVPTNTLLPSNTPPPTPIPPTDTPTPTPIPSTPTPVPPTPTPIPPTPVPPTPTPIPDTPVPDTPIP